MAKSWTELSLAAIKDKFIKVNLLEYERINPAINRVSKSKFTVDEGIKNMNAKRNRYTNVIPWDHSRVLLPVTTNGNDYINASYIELGQDLKYIASQGPKDQTIHHFWAMAFAEAEKRNEEYIFVIMITPLIENDMIKCCKYWPDRIDQKLDMSHEVEVDKLLTSQMTIKYEQEQDKEDYILTRMSLTANGKTKTVLHFHFKNWADSKVPLSGDSLSTLLDDIHNYQQQYNVSVPIVHCSAGVGRTGTFIALDYLKHHPQLLTESDPIFDVFSAMRLQRLMMIQTVHQYIFLYDYFKSFIERD